MIKKWWKVQTEHFTAWDAHEEIGDKTVLPFSVLGIIVGRLLKKNWISWVFFAIGLGATAGYEICQNNLEQGKEKIKLFLKTKVVDSTVDIIVACYKAFVIVMINNLFNKKKLR